MGAKYTRNDSVKVLQSPETTRHEHHSKLKCALELIKYKEQQLVCTYHFVAYFDKLKMYRGCDYSILLVSEKTSAHVTQII